MQLDKCWMDKLTSGGCRVYDVEYNLMGVMAPLPPSFNMGKDIVNYGGLVYKPYGMSIAPICGFIGFQEPTSYYHNVSGFGPSYLVVGPFERTHFARIWGSSGMYTFYCS